MWTQSGMGLMGFRIFTQIDVFLKLSKMIIYLEISLCSLLSLHSSELYMWASLNIPHTAYTIIQAFMIALIQFLIFKEAGLENAESVEELVENMKSAVLPVYTILIITISILQTSVIFRYDADILYLDEYLTH